jgi:DNA-binding PadR family transcriptional regulator
MGVEATTQTKSKQKDARRSVRPCGFLGLAQGVIPWGRSFPIAMKLRGSTDSAMLENITTVFKNTVKNEGEQGSKRLLTDGGRDIGSKTDEELADLLDGVATAAEPALSNYDLSVIGEAVSRLADGEDSQGENTDNDTGDWPVVADGGPAVNNVGASDLSLFQAAALAIITEDNRYGLAIKRELEDWYGEEVNHGRLYPNLDELVEMGLATKTDRDRRTNDYMATPAGRRVLGELIDFFDARVPDEHILPDGGVAVDSPDVDVDQEDNAFVFALMQIDDVSVSIEEGRYVVSITGLDRGTIDAGPVISLANKYGHGIEDVTGDFDDPEVIVEVAR